MLNRSVAYAFYTVVISTILALSPSPVLAGQVGVTWNLSIEPDIKGYYLYFGTQSGSYDAPGSPIFIEHPQNIITITGLQSGQEYFFALTAVDQSGNASLPSSPEISAVISENNPSPDTTPPTISLTGPSDEATVSGMVTISASASDAVGVVGVQFQLDGENLGNEDTTNPYEFSWDTTAYALGTHTLTAIARDGANNTAVSNPILVTVETLSELTVTNLQVENGKNYQVVNQGLVPGATMYIDRSHTFTNIPVEQTGATFIRTANGDKNSSSPTWMSFDVNQPVTVYIAHDSRIKTKPSWLENYTNTGEVLQSTDKPLEIWSQAFPSGNVVLGGNRGSSEGASMYSVVIVGQDSPPTDTTPPSTPAIQWAAIDSSTQATITWSAATDNVTVTGYTLYRNNNPLTTTPNLTYVDTKLSPSTAYSYFVVAYDAADNNSASSTEASVTTPASPDTTPPSSPTIESAVADSSTQATITWSAATDNVAVTGYTLYRNYYPFATTPNLTYVDTNLSPSTSYSYFVVAYDAAGNNSDVFADATVTTPAPADTTPPTVTITSPVSRDTITSIVVVTGAAADNVGVTGVQFQLDGVNLGGVDTTNEYSVSWDTSSILSGTHSLTAIARDEAGNTTTSAPVVVTIDNSGNNNPGTVEISNLQVQSGQAYTVETNGLVPGAKVYIDRAYSFTTIPTALTGITYIQTANSDKNSNGSSFLNFDVNQPVIVYVAHDPRITTKPAWMSSFTNTGQVLVSTDKPLELFSQTFPAGTITLGGNKESGNGYSMYIIAVTPEDGPINDTTPPTAANIDSAVAESSTVTVISWSGASDNVAVSSYTLYRDGIPLITTPNTTYTDTNLTAETTYIYAVMAHDAAGNNSALSANVSITTPMLTQSPPQGTALLMWEKNTESDLSHYIVHFGTQTQVYTTTMNVGLSSTPNTPAYTVTDLPPGTYYFSITAVDTSGNESPHSSEDIKVIRN